MALRPVRAGERVLEIGCGLALPSLVGHRRGVDMTASDCHPLASRFLRNNLRLNHMAPMKYRHGAWDARQPDMDAPAHSTTVRERYDLLIGSDLLYDRDASVALAGFIERHAQSAAEVWIVDPDRGNRPAFSRQMALHGFELTQQRLDSPATADAPLYKGRLLVYQRAA
jgi:predicted nicotinamide N-methyase